MMQSRIKLYEKKERLLENSGPSIQINRRCWNYVRTTTRMAFFCMKVQIGIDFSVTSGHGTIPYTIQQSSKKQYEWLINSSNYSAKPKCLWILFRPWVIPYIRCKDPFCFLLTVSHWLMDLQLKKKKKKKTRKKFREMTNSNHPLEWMIGLGGWHSANYVKIVSGKQNHVLLKIYLWVLTHLRRRWSIIKAPYYLKHFACSVLDNSASVRTDLHTERWPCW